jgi:putative addiction module component (TIGR02574 family)
MARSHQQSNAENLSIAERIMLVEQICDSIVAEQELLEVTRAQQHELDRRLEAYEPSPNLGANWEEVKARLQSKE